MRVMLQRSTIQRHGKLRPPKWSWSWIDASKTSRAAVVLVRQMRRMYCIQKGWLWLLTRTLCYQVEGCAARWRERFEVSFMHLKNTDFMPKMCRRWKYRLSASDHWPSGGIIMKQEVWFQQIANFAAFNFLFYSETLWPQQRSPQ